MVELTDTQKMTIVVARWKSVVRAVSIAETVLPNVPRDLIVEYARSDECLDRVSALYVAYGSL